MTILDGKKAAQHYNALYAQEVKEYVAQGHRAPHLVAILIGDDVPSMTYVRNKVRTCEKIGYRSSLMQMDTEYSEASLLQEIDRLNADDTVDGILVQLPLPAHIDEQKVIHRIDPAKDVDGFHPYNVGQMVLGQTTFVSATPLGITQLLRYYDINPEGMHCVVIGRSNIVGTPISILLSRNAIPGNASVTLCHSRTKNLKALCRQADLLIAAIGRAAFVTADMVKEGAIVVDVGINKVDDPKQKKGYRLEGDVDFENIAPHSSFISPVPGGVGPMTISALMYNTLQAYKKKNIL